ncbi:MAG: DMT family transporter [Nevskiaceae bacterium]
MTPGHPRALAALIAGAICIGFAPIFVRLIDVGYTAAAFWRVALALPVLGLAFWLGGAGLAPGGTPQGRSAGAARSESGMKWLWLAGAFFAADLAVWHQSIRFTSVANSTLLANLAPVFVTAGAVGLFGEHINRRFLAGLVVALAGSGLLVANSFTVSLQTVGGDLLGILTAGFYAGYLLTVSHQRRDTSTIELMWWSTLACAVLLLPVTLATGDALWPQSVRGWAVLVGMALVSQVAGQGLIAWAMAHLPAAFSSVSLLVQPVAAAIFAWVLLAEPFGALQALGGAVVLAGIVICRLATIRTPVPP